MDGLDGKSADKLYVKPIEIINNPVDDELHRDGLLRLINRHRFFAMRDV